MHTSWVLDGNKVVQKDLTRHDESILISCYGNPGLEIAMYLFDQTALRYQHPCVRGFVNIDTGERLDSTCNAHCYPPFEAGKWINRGDNVLFFISKDGETITELSIITKRI